MTRLPVAVLTGTQLRRRRRTIEWLRHGVQLVTLLVVLSIGWQFIGWFDAIRQGRLDVTRPGGVEGFLPISALISLHHWVQSGEASRVHPAGLVILLAVLATAGLLKKAFCSWLCPVGLWSELQARLSRRVFGRQLALPRWIDGPLRALKYLLLGFFVWAIFFQMSAAQIEQFLNSPYNKLADVKMLLFFAHPSRFAVGTILVLAMLSFLLPYSWCRWLCPYGGLLGVVSLLSPLKITRRAEQCIDCNRCSSVCPSRLPVARLARVRSDECTACLSCVAACPVPSALSVEAPRARRITPLAFAAAVVALFFGTLLIAKWGGYWHSSITAEEYARRVQEIDSPLYEHNRGEVRSEPTSE